MGLTGEDAPRLDSLTREDMWDVARALQPGITREEFDDMWAGWLVRREILADVEGSA